MARLGHRVGVLDADFGLGNVDVLLGLAPGHHLGAVLSGDKRVSDVMLDGPSGIRVIPAGSGVRGLTALDLPQWARLVAAIADASRDLDFLLFDTATGITDTVLGVVGLADYALVVTSYDPAAVVDAYAVIKLLHAANAAQPIGVVVNAATSADEAGVVFRQIALAAERFLGRTVRCDGHVLEDGAVRRSTYAQQPHVGPDATSPASRCIRRLACRLVASRPAGPGPWPQPAPDRSDRSISAERCA
jgi:flagellar biosynthesis protein FlhG